MATVYKILPLWYAYSGLSVFVTANLLVLPLIGQITFKQVLSPMLTINLKKIDPGKILITTWNGLPIFIRNRTFAQVKTTRKTKLSSFKDKLARNDNLPPGTLAFDVNRCVNKDNQNLLVVMASCPHLGCLPESTEDGWFCSCHGSRFDASGRIVSGPSTFNMRIPKCTLYNNQLVLEP
ncbi:MAG: ubiquinol-cytochrome c reductase iron-sulfur subunit [Candidatus Hodgkinia cicadicola]